MLKLIGNFILVGTTIAAILCVVFYARVHWERTDVGRQTMALSVSMALILTNASIAVLFGPYPGQQIVRLVVFSSILPVLWWRVVLMVRYAYRARKGERKHDDSLRS